MKLLQFYFNYLIIIYVSYIKYLFCIYNLMGSVCGSSNSDRKKEKMKDKANTQNGVIRENTSNSGNIVRKTVTSSNNLIVNRNQPRKLLITIRNNKYRSKC